MKVQKKKLEDLCRTLQAERIQLRSELNKLEEQSNHPNSDSNSTTDSSISQNETPKISQSGNKQANSPNGNGVVNNTTISASEVQKK